MSTAGSRVIVTRRNGRRTTALRLFAAVALLASGMVASGVRADETIPVTVSIWRFEQWDNPDGGFQQFEGDYYSRVRIGDNPSEESSEISGNPDFGEGQIVSFPYTIHPNWSFTRDIDSDLAEVALSIEIIDADGFGSEPDDVIDVSPRDDDTALSLTFDLTTGGWRGEIPDNQGFAFGDGDLEHHDSDEGGEQGKVFFAITTSAISDSDGDGLLDSWERHGLDENGDGVVDNALPAWGADPNHKDLFVELDWMTSEACVDANDGLCLTRWDIQDMKEAFAAAPLDAGSQTLNSPIDSPPNPDGEPGINLWVDTGALTDPFASEDGAGSSTCDDGLDNGGEGYTDDDDPDCLVSENFGGGNEIATRSLEGLSDDLDENGFADFYELKSGVPVGVGGNFNPLRANVFRYGISARPTADAPGGQGEIGGNDFVDFTHTGKTIMHELGHNLGLDHGGNVDKNCNPNYVSIMNYSYQGVPQGEGGTILDYSPPRFDGGRGRAPLPDLDEDNLDENLVLDPTDAENRFVWLDSDGDRVQTPLNANPNWNNDTDPPLETGLTADIDNDPDDDDDDDDDEGECDDENEGTSGPLLKGFDDWTAISLPFRHFGNSVDDPIRPGVHPDPTRAEQQAIWEEINTTDLSVDLDDDPDPVVAGTSLTYAATVRNEGSNPADGTQLVVEFPDAVTLRSSDGECQESPPGVVRCELGTLLAGDQQVVTLTTDVSPSVVHEAGGPVTITAEASVRHSAGPDASTADNASTETTRVVASADLEVVSFASAQPPTEAVLGQATTITLDAVVRNNGPSTPMDVRADFTASGVSGGVEPVSVSKVEPAVAVGADRSLTQDFTIMCSEPGSLTYSFGLRISPARADDADPDVTNNTAARDFTIECVVPVAVNIRPKGSPNAINVNSEATLAVLTTGAGEYGLPRAFDATTIDGSSARFGPRDGLFGTGGTGSPESHGQGHPEDSYELDERTRDRDLDMVLHFRVEGSGVGVGDTEACVKGHFTEDGRTYTFFGCDSIIIRP
jgi:hypothetical protein